MTIEFVAFGTLTVVALLLLRKFIRYRSLYPFLPRKYNFGKRRNTLRATLALLEERNARVLVETGTARLGLRKTKGDGASTVVFGLWAKHHAAQLHSVDIDPEAISQARAAVAELNLSDSVSFHVADSVAFLQQLTEPVDFLYLDSYDYDKRDPAVQRASQAHHLKEFAAIEGRLHDGSIVLIDDCDQPGGGKGKLVIAKMRGTGWRVLASDYQVLLVRDGGASADVQVTV